MSFHLRVLGAPRLTDGGEQVELPPAWALLLLGFVVSREEGASRAEIVARFWPEEPERAARHNLSQLLYRYRGARWLAGLEVTSRRIRWVGDSDLAGFRRAVAAGEWSVAAEMHPGEFLDGVEAERSASVADWLQSERAELDVTRRDAVLRHASTLSEAGRHGEATDLLRAELTRDLLAEDVLHAYLRSAPAAGRRAQALELYDAFRRQLREELDVEPLPLTAQLAAALRRAAAPPAAPSGLPTHLVPFVGRDIELAELTNSLEDPDCRLLTIVGHGGVGKSRIATRLAQEQAAHFSGGVHFVPLASLTSERYIAPAIASALGIDAQTGDTRRQLAERLASEPTLIVLDNFEHLTAGAELVDHLLRAAPALRIVVTSREPLGLSHECRYELDGLSFPADDTDDSLVYDAMQLLMASARRASSSFMLAESERPAAARICRLLGGLPLGLELAGSWLRLLTPKELAAELAADLDMLQAEGVDRPARHRSLRVVFEHSWELLGEEERRALERLAVFRGGFDRAAAQAVSQASLRTLLALAGRSLLGRTQSGRFELLETVRQYALEKLTASEAEAARRRHAGFYLELAERAESALKGPEQVEWLDRLALERDNLRGALDWARGAGEAETGLRLASALQQFWWVRGPYGEGPARIDELLALPGAAQLPALRAKALHRSGTLVQLQGDMEGAGERYRAALSLAEEEGDRRLQADALHSLGLQAAVQGDPQAAFPFYEAADALQREVGDRWGLSVTLNNMGIALMYRGDYAQAIPLLHECLELKRSLGDPQGIAYALNNLGTVHLYNGDLSDARPYVEESLELKERLGDDSGVATSVANLGRLAVVEGDHAGARREFDRSIGRLVELGNRWTLLWVVTGVVKLEALAGRYERAVRLAGGSRALAEALGVTTLPSPNAGELALALELAELELPAERVRELLDEGRELDAMQLAAYATGGGAGRRLPAG